VSRRVVEIALWILAAAALVLGGTRWRDALPAAEAPGTPPVLLSPPAPVRVPPERLGEATRGVAAGNPFRLDRAPAPLSATEMAASGADPGMPPPYQPPPPPRPQLSVSGIAGPPWRGVLEGVPGREGGVVVQRGDELGELRIRDVTATTVVVAAPDTTWRLPVRRPWQ
jgi:hypothetical protein